MNRSILGPGVAAIILTLLAASCESAPASYSGAPFPPVTSTALRPTVEQGAVDLYLAGVRAEETLQAVRALETATAVAGRATATAQAQAIAATRAAWEVQATATAWAATATAASHQATATARAQALAATATATSWAATATADAVAWAQAATATRSAWEVQATSTAVAAAAIATAQAAQAEQARLEAERARLVYPVKAYGPWALLFAAFALMVWAGYRLTLAGECRLRAIPRDARGDAPILILPLRSGETVIDPDRSFGPALEVQDGVSQPQLAPAEYQAQVTARDQAVDLVSRGLPGQAAAYRHRRLPPNLAGTMLPRPIVRVVPPEQVRPWLEEVEPKVLEHLEETDA